MRHLHKSHQDLTNARILLYLLIFNFLQNKGLLEHSPQLSEAPSSLKYLTGPFIKQSDANKQLNTYLVALIIIHSPSGEKNSAHKCQEKTLSFLPK